MKNKDTKHLTQLHRDEHQPTPSARIDKQPSKQVRFILTRTDVPTFKMVCYAYSLAPFMV